MFCTNDRTAWRIEMKVLVIPDIHLKPWIFERALELMNEGAADRAVCLMDIADDWNQELNLYLYISTYDAAIQFAKRIPETLWCYGNHDVCYLWDQRETGFSRIALPTVCEKLRILRGTIPQEHQIAYVQRIDNVLFSHGGLTDSFVREQVPASCYNTIDKVIGTVNGLGLMEMWQNTSPIWSRPQYSREKMYKPRKLMQVVGHTPVTQIERRGNLISCDVFSTFRDGSPIGTQEFLLLNTLSWEYCGVR